MSRTRLFALLALVPAAALAQVPALDAARAAKATAERADARTAEAAEAALAGGAPGSAPAAPEDRAPPPAAEDGAVGLPVEGSAIAAEEAKGAVPPPDTYTVRPGDTLWDLSGRFLNNPWYWPKIWSYNPDITNPHWIYPGNLLKFYPGSEEAPARVEPIAGPAEPEVEEIDAPRELEEVTKGELNAPDPALEDADVVAVSGPYKIGFIPSKGILASHETFVTPRQLAESGAITAAFEEKLLLVSLDRAYVRFHAATDVKAGETYVLYRTERPMRHPRTGELFGWQSTILGAAKVVSVDKNVATVVITQAFEPIERGVMVGPWTEKFLRRVERRANRKAMQAMIIGGKVRVVTQLGEQTVVFVDKGAKDGVEEGNVFTVIRSGDLYGRTPNTAPWDSRFPRENVGELLVIDVKERASAALVTRSRTELLVGDRLEMRAVGQATAGAGGR
jgi:LysM domain